MKVCGVCWMWSHAFITYFVLCSFPLSTTKVTNEGVLGVDHAFITYFVLC